MSLNNTSEDAPMEKKKRIPTAIRPLELAKLAVPVGNVYQAVAIIGRRARQISLRTKEELDSKLEDFATPIDTLDEIQENAEQIEICRYYERQPTPSTVATHEFIDNKLFYRPIEHDEDSLPADLN